MPHANDAPEGSYTLTFERRPDYIYIHVKSERMEFEAARKLAREVAEELDRCDTFKVLAEIEVVGRRLSAIERYLVTAEFPQLGLTRHKIALLYPDTDEPEEYGFSETLMMNRGVWTKAFTSLGAAERWLAED